MRYTKLAVLALGVSLAATAAAKGLNMQPGLWQMEVKATVTGLPFQMAPRSHSFKKCLTRDDVQNPWNNIEKNTKENCKYSNLKTSARHMSWTMKCSGNGNVEGTGEITLDSPTRYRGRTDMTIHQGGQTMKTHADVTGHRLGPCSGNGNR